MQLVTHPTPTPKLIELKKTRNLEIPDLSKKRMAISSPPGPGALGRLRYRETSFGESLVSHVALKSA